MARKQDKKDQSGAPDELEGNVDQIRQILFGGQMRDYEKRFAEMESRLTKTIKQLSNGLEKRIERLDTFAKRELEKITEQVKSERKTRADDDKQTVKQVDNLGKQVEGWFAEVEEQMEAEARELRSSFEQMSSSVLGEAKDLANAKLDREDLADVLSEVALRLKKDLKLPKG